MYGLGVLTTLAVISSTSPAFLIMFAVIAVGYFHYARLFSHSAREFRRLDSVSKSPLFSIYGEAIQGVAVIRAFGSSARFMALMLERATTNVSFYAYLWGTNVRLSPHPPRPPSQLPMLADADFVHPPPAALALDALLAPVGHRRRPHGLRPHRRRRQDRRAARRLHPHIRPQHLERDPVPRAALHAARAVARRRRAPQGVQRDRARGPSPSLLWLTQSRSSPDPLHPARRPPRSSSHALLRTGRRATSRSRTSRSATPTRSPTSCTRSTSRSRPARKLASSARPAAARAL